VEDLAIMTRRKRRVLIGVAVVTILGVLCLLTPYTRRHYTCLQCRFNKTVETYWGIARVTETPNECSQWYAATYPAHQHDWKKSSCTYQWRAFTRSWSCGSGHPVFQVPADVQKAYLSACTAEQIETWFALLESEDLQDQQRAVDLAADMLWPRVGKPRQQDGEGTGAGSESARASADPDEIHVVMEMLDRPAFPEAMPAAEPMKLEQYQTLRDKCVSGNPAWRPESAFTYRVEEGGQWRSYWLALVSFDRARATIAELTQFQSRGWDWIAVYHVDRCDEIDADFGIDRILTERAQLIGGVRYGMSVADVIHRKGAHFKVNHHAEAGSGDLVYDDVSVSVRDWWPGVDRGRVVRVAPMTDSVAVSMREVPYEDER
jgi:G:T-mismatch repair DNA endonuclease (very short patch repair protein)